MAVLYIKEQGSYIQKRGEKLVVTKGGHTLFEMPTLHVDNLSIIGNVQISTQALHLFLEKGIDVSYFSYSGKYLGHTAAESSKNIFLRFEQYRFYTDEILRLNMAKCIVANKIDNQITVIKEHRWGDSGYNWKEDIKSIEEQRRQLTDKTMPNEVLGVEGICANIYFKSFAKMLCCDFVFEGRNRRPPKDPVNIILSLAYTFLTKEVSAALDAESFETYLGFLHGVRYGRKSLALDIVEEFRQPIVDRFVILTFNKRIFGKFDFEEDEDGRIALAEEGFHKFCQEYERWMTGKNSASGDKNFRKRILEQVGLLKKAITKHEKYEPFNWREKHALSD